MKRVLLFFVWGSNCVFRCCHGWCSVVLLSVGRVTVAGCLVLHVIQRRVGDFDSTCSDFVLQPIPVNHDTDSFRVLIDNASYYSPTKRTVRRHKLKLHMEQCIEITTNNTHNICVQHYLLFSVVALLINTLVYICWFWPMIEFQLLLRC